MGKKKVEEKLKPMTLIEMELSISTMFDVRKCLIVPNVSYGFKIHEIDLLVVRNSGYAIEVEIKRTIQDLKKDFTKKHNHVDKKNRICELYYAIPLELLEKSLPLIPENAGIITCNLYKDYKKRLIPKAKIYRKAKRIPNVVPLTKDERYNIARLGVMRVWNLKKKLNKILNNG
jgi:hypothetical protein